MNPGPCLSPSVTARFCAAAQTYHDESSMQHKVAERLATSMLPMEPIDSVLEMGCGTGFLTELLRKRFPEAVIHALDIARPMIKQARERLGECGQIHGMSPTPGNLAPTCVLTWLSAAQPYIG